MSVTRPGRGDGHPRCLCCLRRRPVQTGRSSCASAGCRSATSRRCTTSWSSVIPNSSRITARATNSPACASTAPRPRFRRSRSTSSRSPRWRRRRCTLAVTNAKLDMRMVADLIQDGRPGWYDEPYVVRKDGPIKTIEDIKGKRVATNAIGSAADTAMRIMLRKHNIQDSDFTTIETNFANMFPMIEDGKVDMITVLPQDVKRVARQRPLPHALHRGSRRAARPRPWPGRCAPTSSRRTARRSSISSRIICARCTGSSIPKHHDEAVAIAAEVTKQKPDELGYFFTHDDFYRAPGRHAEPCGGAEGDRQFGAARHPQGRDHARQNMSIFRSSRTRRSGSTPK